MLWLNGNKRFTELLADKQLDNVIYVYGKYDESIGGPKPYELEFLSSKKVEVLELKGGHVVRGIHD